MGAVKHYAWPEYITAEQWGELDTLKNASFQRALHVLPLKTYLSRNCLNCRKAVLHIPQPGNEILQCFKWSQPKDSYPFDLCIDFESLTRRSLLDLPAAASRPQRSEDVSAGGRHTFYCCFPCLFSTNQTGDFLSACPVARQISPVYKTHEV